MREEEEWRGERRETGSWEGAGALESNVPGSAPAPLTQWGRALLLCGEFQGDLFISLFPFLSSSLCPCLVTG